MIRDRILNNRVEHAQAASTAGMGDLRLGAGGWLGKSKSQQERRYRRFPARIWMESLDVLTLPKTRLLLNGGEQRRQLPGAGERSSEFCFR